MSAHCQQRPAEAKLRLTMARQFAAVLLLSLWVIGSAVPLAHAVPANKHDCRCDPGICRCPHKHQAPTRPGCHLPNGSTLPSLESCDTDEQPAPATAVFLLPPKPSAAQLLPVARLTVSSAQRIPLLASEVNPPPPRTPLA